ncbi:MAG: hypothetical protein GX765_06465 [Candidatus Moranbacteria bacterium]|nr:hypothetical protein [Candidatus Moranbacteria bacterium]
MKKTTATVCALFLSSFVAGSAIAVEKYQFLPVEEVSGIIKDVKFDNPDFHTTLEFSDGRVVIFNSVYVGRVFPKNKYCTFKYKRDNTELSQGRAYILDIKCRE